MLKMFQILVPMLGLAAAMATLTACGQQGALYLPAPSARPASAPVSLPTKPPDRP